jgi:ribosomal protein S12 methylthiotransferase
MKVATVSLGCVKNIIDTEVFLGNLALSGAILTPDPADADVVIVNTCSFIAPAVEESLETLRQLVGTGKSRKVVAVGCMVQHLGEELFRLVPGLAGAVGLDEERLLPALLEEIQRGPRVFRRSGPARGRAAADTARLRITPAHYAYLRVSEGCSARCTFCVIPRIRGRLRSKPIRTVLAEARELVASGVRELILVAQDLTAYGRDLPGRPELAELLAELEKLRDLYWIRLLYLHPKHVTPALIDRIARSEKILPCLDLPFQHAATSVLGRMGRGMTTEDARRLVRTIRQAVPPAVLRGTFLVGFPGESEQAFQTLCDFVEKTGFPRGGVFRWRPQEGTPAVRFPDRVRAREADRRRSRLRRLLADNARRFNRERLGKTVTVVVDEARPECTVARSFAEAPDVDPVIYLPPGAGAPGTFTEIRITRRRGLDLAGEPL